MATMIVRFRVADFDHWKRVFDAMALPRLENGIDSATVHRDADDPATVVTILTARSLREARAWARSDVLRAAMADGGIEGPAAVQILTDLE
jgi:hypothetical protein